MGKIRYLSLLLLSVTQSAALTSTEISAFTVSGSYSATVNVNQSPSDKYIITASGMPDHAWQRVNPNTPTDQNYNLDIPKTPTAQTTPGCLPMGMIGIARTGVAIFNPLTSSYLNAVEGSDAETFDTCDGHADNRGTYHYHKHPSSCLDGGNVDEFIGVAMDGYPIYSPKASWKSSGSVAVTTADLDQCHGKEVNGEYRYYMTADWPYVLGCFKGSVIHPTIRTEYNCGSTSGYDGSWGYMCSCVGDDNNKSPETIRTSTPLIFAFTGLEDIETCIGILEQNDWDLMKSVTSVMPGNDGGNISPSGGEPPPIYSPMDVEDISPPPYPKSSFVGDVADAVPIFDPSSAAGPSTSAAIPSTSFGSAKKSRSGGGARILNFKVEYRDQNVYLSVPDTEPVMKVKTLLSEKLGIPSERQHLRGWSTRKTRVEDDGVKKDFSLKEIIFKAMNTLFSQKILQELHLPKENTLFLLTPDIPNPTLIKPRQENDDLENLTLTEALNRTYTLHITFSDNGRSNTYNLNMQGCKTIGEVKGDVYALTNLPARHQIWSGWPEAAKDDSMTLGCCGLSIPTHKLQLTKSNIVCRPKRNDVDIDLENSDDDDDMNASIDDELFDQDDRIANKQTLLSIPGQALVNLGLSQPIPDQAQTYSVSLFSLVPESVKDEVDALEHFTKEFRERYGESHPVFFVGSLENALKEALQGRAKDRKLLAIYLHHDASILSNVFCSQILCAESIVNFLSANFLTWAWDMTNDTNSARLITMVTRHFGNVVAGQIRGHRPDQLPMMMIISRSRATNEVVDMISGSLSLDEVMMRLIHDSESFQEQQKADIQDEEERDARERIRREQEEAFQESLAADKRKAEEQKRLQEEEIRKQKEEESKRQEEEQRKMAIQEVAATQIPDEPSESCKLPVSCLRFRMPDGTIKSRRFLASEPLKHVLYFITSEGFHTEDYKVLTTFPRRDISQLEEDRSLEELKLYPQETLILEER
ncbi:hypothetical protein FSP39_019169 [Pinctada imbricata]|uniref:UBX domain-containing protein n=1 Tax=Pinctada imbricata TaxID=66713 RepID=A0AA89C1Z0_PINIB|nr:hypothetical protein FSP39_019169 [Pinctada imbricata]